MGLGRNIILYRNRFIMKGNGGTENRMGQGSDILKMEAYIILVNGNMGIMRTKRCEFWRYKRRNHGVWNRKAIWLTINEEIENGKCRKQGSKCSYCIFGPFGILKAGYTIEGREVWLYVYNRKAGSRKVGIIISLALLYQPKKNTNLSGCGGNDTNTIYRNINGRFTSRFSKAASWTVTLPILMNRQRIWCFDWSSKWLTRRAWPNNLKRKILCFGFAKWTRYKQGQEK